MKCFTGISGLALAAHVFSVVPLLASEETVVSESETPFLAEYDFYIGGLAIAEILFEGKVSPLGYNADSVVETRGIVELLVSGRVTANAEGYRHTQGHLAPDSYRTNYEARDEIRTISMEYSGEIADVTIEPSEPPKPYDTEAAAHRGSLDPVTAAVTMMTPAASDDLCNRTIPVFDGKRRYDIVLLPLSKRPDITDPPEPSWKTELVRCFGVYERIAGFEANLQGAQRYFPFDVWFEDDGDGLFRIVRLAGKTRLGYAIGTLRPDPES